MATTNKQRWGILVIMIVMVFGTVGSFIAMALSADNDSRKNVEMQKLQEQYQKEYAEYQEKVQKQGEELSATHYAKFAEYKSYPAEFDRDGVSELIKEDLVVGEGAEINSDTKFAVYYVGWNPKGKIFDSSFEDSKEALKAPLAVADGLESASLIEGWKQGLVGMRISGVRQITVPSDLAYKETGSGDDIPPNTPIKFIVMAIDLPEQFEQPQMSMELMQYLYGY